MKGRRYIKGDVDFWVMSSQGFESRSKVDFVIIDEFANVKRAKVVFVFR